MATRIRPATIADHEAIARIVAEVAALHAGALPGQFRVVPEPFSVEQHRIFLDSADHHVVVAERGGAVVGYARMQVRTSPDIPMVVPRMWVLLDEIGVLAAERGGGIGRLLVAEAARWARERGATSIELNVYEFNEAAIAFYERLGFTTLRRTMARPIELG